MVTGKTILVRISALLIALILTFCLGSTVFAGTVVIKPGRFDHFTLLMPDKAVSGENFVVKLSVYDANNNLITDFSETGKEFSAVASGSATVQPSVLGSSSFSGGVASVVVNSRKAEKIIFSIMESGGSVPVISRDVIVAPNKLDHFVLQAPGTITAGKAFDIKVTAKDFFDNTVQDLDIGKNLKITSIGISSVRVQSGDAVDFRDGHGTVNLLSEKAGNVVIELQDVISGSRGKTEDILVTSAALSYFRLQASKSAVAGEPFDLLITAFDAFDNVVTDYVSTGSGVRLSTSGRSKIEPAIVSASEFRNGQAIAKVIYEKAEQMQISARESGKEQFGKTQEIQVLNATPDHFVVITPDTAMSGQKFRVKIEAYDRFNNLVDNFNFVGNDVMLNTTGSGTISPSKIPPSAFTGGTAVANVTYDKAESFQITARMAVGRQTGRMIAISEQEMKRDMTPVPDKAEKGGIGQPVEDKPKASIIKEEHRAQPEKKSDVVSGRNGRTEKDRLSVKSDVEKKPEVEQKKQAADKKGVPGKDSSVKKTVTIEKKVTEKKRPEKRSVSSESEKELPVAKPAEKKPEKTAIEGKGKPPVVAAKKEDKKTDKPTPYNISKVSIIEANKKAMLVINTSNPNGNLDFSDEIESKYGKEWLKLKIRPALNSAGKSFKFKSAFIGDVLVEEDKTAGESLVYVYIELIPSGVAYDIARIKNTLVVTLSNP
jgi:hypothetical protein